MVMTIESLRNDLLIGAPLTPEMTDALLAALDVVEACEDFATNGPNVPGPDLELDAFFTLVSPA